MGKRIGWDKPRCPWELPLGRQLTREESGEIAAMKDGVCRLCLRADQALVYEHDHAVGIHGLRQLTCQRCNCHMAGVDAGRYAIDQATRSYLMEPWHLTRRGERLQYDPLVSVRISDLSPADRREVNRLSWEWADCLYSMRKVQPIFEHAGVKHVLAQGDMRPALRLRYLNTRGLPDLDIAESDDRRSSFQRLHLQDALALRLINIAAA